MGSKSGGRRRGDAVSITARVRDLEGLLATQTGRLMGLEADRLRLAEARLRLRRLALRAAATRRRLRACRLRLRAARAGLRPVETGH